MPACPTLSELQSPYSLTVYLSLLLEPTEILVERLVPELAALYASSAPDSHERVLIDGEKVMQGWSFENKAKFVEGHPRIGEGDVLSELSKKEQGVGGAPTTQKTLDRLRELNSKYEVSFPGLRYITFVNGRPRAAIVPEMEGLLEAGDARVRPRGSEEWNDEVDRAVGDVWKIGRARLAGLAKEDRSA